MRNVPAIAMSGVEVKKEREGAYELPALSEVEMYFIKDCCYIKLYQDYILCKNKVLFFKISDSSSKHLPWSMN